MNEEMDLDLENEEIEEEAEEPTVADEAEAGAPQKEPDEDDFEFDENGDVIIPDDKDEEPEEDPEKAPDEEEKEPPATEQEEAPDEKAPPADEEKEALRRELEALRRQTRDTLKKMGVEAESELEGLERLAAEADGVSEEEYRKKRDEEQEIEAARLQIRIAAFEKKKAADLAVVQGAYPDAKQYASVDDFPNSKRFKELMDSGKMTAAEAFAASHPDLLRTSAKKSPAESLAGTKSHIKSSVPKGAAREKITMSRATLAEWRELFPGKSDKELVELYKKTYTK